jgi:hypothetical protein
VALLPHHSLETVPHVAQTHHIDPVPSVPMCQYTRAFNVTVNARFPMQILYTLPSISPHVMVHTNVSDVCAETEHVRDVFKNMVEREIQRLYYDLEDYLPGLSIAVDALPFELNECVH